MKRKMLPLPSWVNLELLMTLFGEERYFFVLDSSKSKDPESHWTYVAWNPTDILELNTSSEAEDGAERMERFLQSHQNPSSKKPHGCGPFAGGFLTFVSYDLGMSFVEVPTRFMHNSIIPLGFIGYYPLVIAINEKNSKVKIVFEESLKELAIEIRKVLQSQKGKVYQGTKGCFYLKEIEEYPDYYDKVKRIQDHIYEGDVYQVNYTRGFQGYIKNIDTKAQYLELRKRNPSPFGAYIQGDGWSIQSTSPERLVRCIGGTLQTKPIKGTIGKGKTPFQDRKNKKWLMSSPKDRAELLMIVDLERNDLSKVSRTGTVHVDRLYGLESYETVHHLVATISSKKEDALGPIGVLKGIFPGGSITGTPKKRSMEIIDQLETHPRGMYTGSIGYIDHNGDFDYNIAIRTILTEGDQVRFNVGGGITWKSNPLDEYNETEDKGLGLKRGLGFDDNNR